MDPLMQEIGEITIQNLVVRYSSCVDPTSSVVERLTSRILLAHKFPNSGFSFEYWIHQHLNNIFIY